jgi:hypothetical protein
VYCTKKIRADFFHVQNSKYESALFGREIRCRNIDTTLERILKDIKIDPNKTTHLEIPSPGILTINKSYEYFGSIFIEQNKQLIKLYDLNPRTKTRNHRSFTTREISVSLSLQICKVRTQHHQQIF